MWYYSCHSWCLDFVSHLDHVLLRFARSGVVWCGVELSEWRGSGTSQLCKQTPVRRGDEHTEAPVSPLSPPNVTVHRSSILYASHSPDLTWLQPLHVSNKLQDAILFNFFFDSILSTTWTFIAIWGFRASSCINLTAYVKHSSLV